MRWKTCLCVVLSLCCALGILLPAAAVPPGIMGELHREGLPFLAEYPDNPVLPGISPTTGLPFEGVYAPVVLVIDNARAAHPHWGVFDADFLIQVPNAGGGGTKLLGLFSDTLPQAAGGSRSARTPFVDVARQWGAAFAYAGYPGLDEGNRANVQDRLRAAGMRYQVTSFNLLGNNDYTQRVKGYVSPHDLSVNLKAVQALAIKNGAVFTPRPYLFTDTLPSGYPQVTGFSVRHYGEAQKPGLGEEDSYSSFAYDSERAVYTRATNAGPYVDRDLPETPIAFANVIVLRTRFSYSGIYVLLEGLTGTGAADIFMGGQYIRGGWYRKDLDSRTVFVDEQGREIALQRGKTFLILTNDVTGIVLE